MTAPSLHPSASFSPDKGGLLQRFPQVKKKKPAGFLKKVFLFSRKKEKVVYYGSWGFHADLIHLCPIRLAGRTSSFPPPSFSLLSPFPRGHPKGTFHSGYFKAFLMSMD
jgi:hypothetical protein